MTEGFRARLALRAFEKRGLPPGVTRRRKHGFYLPLDVMAPPSLHRAVADLLLGDDSRTRSFLDPALVRDWVSRFSAGGRAPSGRLSREGLDQRVLMLTSLEIWLRS